MKKNFLLIFLLCFLFSCSQEKKQKEIVFSTESGNEIVLYPTKFSDLPNWSGDNLNDMLQAFSSSCERIMKETSPYLGKAEIKLSSYDYQYVCHRFFDEKISDGKAFKKFVQNNFTPYLITENGDDYGRFTSYYQARIVASFEKDDKYKYPVYGMPVDLLSLNLHDFDEKIPETKLIGRIDGNKFVPYFSRKEIENDANIQKNIPVLLYADNLTDIFLMQIQGSATAFMADGKTLNLAYAGNNGRKFSGIGSVLLADDRLGKGKASMEEVKKWLEDNPEEAVKYMQKNERYVFMRISDVAGTMGAQGVVLTPQRSLAVDESKLPIGALLWLQTSGPEGEKIEKMVIAQDTGKAIKGTIRGDYFWGYGDDALAASGKMSSRGRYFIFVPNSDD